MSKPNYATAKEDLEDATKGFDAVFGDDIVKAREIRGSTGTQSKSAAVDH